MIVAVKVIDIKSDTTIAVGDVAIRKGRAIPSCPDMVAVGRKSEEVR